MKLQFPFETQRPVQKEMVDDVTKCIAEKKHLIAHAPTGLGKTAASLSPALNYALENGKTVIFLTPKHTQHQIVVDTLRKVKEKNKINVNVVDFIGKRWMCLVPGVQSLSSRDFAEFCREIKKEERCTFYNKLWKKNELSKDGEKIISDLKKKSPLHVEEVCKECGDKEACPYEVSCQLAKSANVLVADYYHIFHPSVRKAFLMKTNKELKDCIIVVDEAQNLPGRIREVLSSTISNFSLNRAIKEARKFEYEQTANDLTEIYNILLDMCQKNLEKDKECYIDRDEFIAEVELVGKDFESLASDLLLIGEKIRAENKVSYVGSIGSFLQYWLEEGDGFVRILRRSQWKDKSLIQLNFRCLDPAIASKELFEDCHSAVLMSGTLTPTRMYRDILGMDEERTKCREYDNPFPKANKLSLIIPDTTTKFTRRKPEEFQKIADWCAQVVNSIKGNVAVFFPSYWIRDQVMKYFEVKSRKSIFVEQQGLSKHERLLLLEQFKEYSDLGAVFMGATGGSFSVDYSEPIFILEDNSIKLVKIGEFVDKNINNKKDTHSKVACFDSKYKIKFKPINKVIRHKINENLFELILDTQRTVKVTGSHSVFCLEDGQVVSKKTSDIEVGDYVVMPKILPKNKKKKLTLDFLREISKLPQDLTSEIYIAGVDPKYLVGKTRMKRLGCPHNRYRGTISFRWLKCTDIWKEDLFNNFNLKIGSHHGIKLPRILKLDKKFMRLLGYYVSEGHCTSGRHSNVSLTFGVHEKNVIKDAKDCISSVFSTNINENLNSWHRSSLQLTFGGKIISLLFSHILKAGKNARDKRIPSIVFDAPIDYKIEFLKGYFAGDGTACKKSELSCKTVSKDLASDIMYLFLQLGIIASLTKIKMPERTVNGRKIKKGICYHVFISNVDQLERILDIIPRKYLKDVKKYINKSRKNKKRRTLPPQVIPVKESGLLELYNLADSHKPRQSRGIVTRIKQRTIRKDLCLELLEYIVKNARCRYDKKLEKNIRKLIESDFAFAKVKSIKKCNPTSDYVYDLSVKGDENFIGGNGGIVLHNSEGVDLPGKFLNGVVIVGVPLDSPDLETKSLIEYYDKLFGAGWDYGYVFPAMNRVVQAAGRAIRSESDRGVVVLIDERFTWKNYFKCLPLDWKIVVTKNPIERIEKFMQS